MLFINIKCFFSSVSSMNKNLRLVHCICNNNNFYLKIISLNNINIFSAHITVMMVLSQIIRRSLSEENYILN